MPRLELKPLTPEAQALAQRIGELLKGAKVGQTVTLPPDLAQAIDDSVREATAPAIMARRRMEWLHSRDACNVDGYEWGIFRVKWENGRAVEVCQTAADFSDLDAAMRAVELPHSYGPASCADCGHKWTAVWPLGAEALECPKCHSTNTDRTAAVPPARRFTGVGELERSGYIPAGSAAEREGNAGVAASPVRQIEDCPELNLSNYDEVDVERLNDWAIRVLRLLEVVKQAKAVMAYEVEGAPSWPEWDAKFAALRAALAGLEEGQ